MWTALHAPAVNVPGLKGDNGMPVGLTVVGARYADMKTLHFAGLVGNVFAKGTV